MFAKARPRQLTGYSDSAAYKVPVIAPSSAWHSGGTFVSSVSLAFVVGSHLLSRCAAALAYNLNMSMAGFVPLGLRDWSVFSPWPSL